MNIGLIGCGGIAPAHLKVYRSIKDAIVLGVCDLNLDRAKALAREYDIGQTFTDYFDMLEKLDLDLVDICTPVSTHARIVCDVAKNAPAILVEKPMALTVSECDKMINDVRRFKRKLCIGHSQIFSPLVLRAKSLVDSGFFKLSSVTTIQKESFDLLRDHGLAPAWNVTPEQKGIIWEVCCHLAYLQLHFLPDVEDVYAVGGKVRYPVYDDFSVVLRTKGSEFGVIELSWISRETEITYELRDCTGRRIQLYRDYDWFLEKSEPPPFSVGGVARNIYVDQRRILQKWSRFALSYFKHRKMLPHFNLIYTYMHCIRNDLPPPVSSEEGRRTINLLESIEKSLDERRSVRLSN